MKKCEIASLSSRSNSLKFAILQETSGFQIGEIKLCYNDKEDEPCISVLIYDEFKRQGYASEAVGALYEKIATGCFVRTKCTDYCGVREPVQYLPKKIVCFPPVSYTRLQGGNRIRYSAGIRLFKKMTEQRRLYRKRYEKIFTISLY